MADKNTPSSQPSPAPSFPHDEVIERAKKGDEKLSEDLDYDEAVHLKDPAQRQEFLRKALEIREAKAARHLDKEFKEARVKFREHEAKDDEAKKALQHVEGEISKHADELAMQEKRKAVAEASPAKTGTFWDYVTPWVEKIQGAFSWLLDQAKQGLAALGPQINSMLSMFGMSLPSFLLPEPKQYTTLRDAFKADGLTVTPEDGENIQATLQTLETTFNDVNAVSEKAISMQDFTKAVIAETKSLNGSASSVSLRTINSAIARAKRPYVKTPAPAPAAAPTTGSPKTSPSTPA